ncbi:DUF397 domain-containing protein [Actinoalloteichus hymeniacidonis]|uniref:DUF397 family protein n=1 Tax=Actinoalloteichus hymeniacidonis TaxID=340345 RepID=A0AAC9HSC2_9PSEU|nr:DUF397 domain-containing protein [Actinoalloteichus hymeniacidonis]AOS64086.1 putative DUF397 family protein [Actinoalloteichus hymeniacidonis]MBB5907851.1 hypothetical protein [Actinoalloteichus hymeniacidonis]
MTRLLEHATWRKARRSQNTSACIEVGQAPGLIGIRDTKDRAGGTLVVDRVTFGAFLAAVKSNRVG